MLSKSTTCSFLVGVVSLSHFVQKPFRDEAVIRIGLENLNWLLTAAFALALFLVILFYHLRQTIYTWMPVMLLLNSLFLAFQFSGSDFSESKLIIYFVVTGAFNLSLISLASAMVFEILLEKAGVIQLAQAGSAILGPLISLSLSTENRKWVLLIAALLSLCGYFLTLSLSPEKKKIDNARDRVAEGSAIPHLVAHTFLYTMVSILFYFLLLNTISLSFSADDRMTAFAFAELGSNVLGFVVYWLLERSASCRKLNFLALPVFSFLLLLSILVSPMASFTLIMIIVFKIVKNGVRTTGRDLALMQLAPVSFIPAKNMLDTVVYRSGDMVGAWVIHWLNGSVRNVLFVCMGIVIIWLYVSIILNKSLPKKSKL